MWSTFSIVFFFYIAYFLVLLFYNKNSYIKKEKDPNFYPSVSMIVPVYNEQSIIAKKLNNIKEMKYPKEKLEIIFVDGNSTDNTKKIILEKIKNFNKNIKLIEQKKRKGYTQAVIQGILTSKGEIIFATDAASYHYPDTINQLIKHFIDPKIGAVFMGKIVSHLPAGTNVTWVGRILLDLAA